MSPLPCAKENEMGTHWLLALALEQTIPNPGITIQVCNGRSPADKGCPHLQAPDPDMQLLV